MNESFDGWIGNNKKLINVALKLKSSGEILTNLTFDILTLINLKNQTICMENSVSQYISFMKASINNIFSSKKQTII